jgi:hypothetical protein
MLFITAMGRAIPAAPFFVIGGGEGQGTAGAGSADGSSLYPMYGCQKGAKYPIVHVK